MLNANKDHKECLLVEPMYITFCTQYEPKGFSMIFCLNGPFHKSWTWLQSKSYNWILLSEKTYQDAIDIAEHGGSRPSPKPIMVKHYWESLQNYCETKNGVKNEICKKPIIPHNLQCKKKRK